MYRMKVCNLSKSYGKHRILEDVSYGVRAGKIYGLLGKNGSGKTTFLKIIARLTPIRMYADKVSMMDAKGRLSAFIDQPACYMNLRVIDNLRLYAMLHMKNPHKREEAVQRMIRDFELRSMLKKKAGELSLGMFQKVKSAMTFLSDADLLIFDEPFNGLDMEATLFIQEKMNAAKACAKTIIITSHQIDKLVQICDSFVVLHEGKLTPIGTSALRKNSLEEMYSHIVEGGEEKCS